jgi:WD40 repeat protein
MTASRAAHTATFLPDGKVFIAGGLDGSGGYLNTAEIYDPAAGTFTASTGDMYASRSSHTATLLPNGTVLIAGGYRNANLCLNTAEIYDPAAGTFSPATGTMTAARCFHKATLLPNGAVLITGGSNDRTAELYDPATRTFTTAGNMNGYRSYHSATLLPNGKVLIAGGKGPDSYTNTAEIYDTGLGYNAGRQPVISGVKVISGKFVINGAGFMGDSEGSSGNTGSSSSGIPVLQLQKAEGGDLHIISPDPDANWSSTSFTSSSSSLAGLMDGYYLFSIIANGIPSNANIIFVAPGTKTNHGRVR